MADWPTDTHPLNAIDAERSKARVADIQLGLTSSDDAWFWVDKAKRRVTALEEDDVDFGLLPHETVELQLLRDLLP